MFFHDAMNIPLMVLPSYQTLWVCLAFLLLCPPHRKHYDRFYLFCLSRRVRPLTRYLLNFFDLLMSLQFAHCLWKFQFRAPSALTCVAVVSVDWFDSMVSSECLTCSHWNFGAGTIA